MRTPKHKNRMAPYTVPNRVNSVVPETYFDKEVPWYFEKHNPKNERPIAVVKPTFHTPKTACNPPVEVNVPPSSESSPPTATTSNFITPPPSPMRRVGRLTNVL